MSELILTNYKLSKQHRFKVSEIKRMRGVVSNTEALRGAIDREYDRLRGRAVPIIPTLSAEEVRLLRTPERDGETHGEHMKRIDRAFKSVMKKGSERTDDQGD